MAEPIGGGPVSLQTLHGLGLNPFAVELLAESFHTSAFLKRYPDTPVAFQWDGIKITLERVAEPHHPRVRRELGLVVPEPVCPACFAHERCASDVCEFPLTAQPGQ